MTAYETARLVQEECDPGKHDYASGLAFLFIWALIKWDMRGKNE